MKVLVSVTSWVSGALHGEHQAVRDACMSQYTGWKIEHKFFVGDGTATGEDESLLRKNWIGNVWEVKANATALPNQHIDYNPLPDEVVLHVPDDYIHLSYKLREQCRWAVARKFDYAFIAAGDTYIDMPRLLASDFAAHEYSGYWGNSYINADAGCAYAGGGRGFWLNSRALSIISNAGISHWAADLWIGKVLKESGISLYDDVRYQDYPRIPLKENEYITSHLFGEPTGRYNPQRMYEVHRARQRSYENGSE
jgi:hypothetical protein